MKVLNVCYNCVTHYQIWFHIVSNNEVVVDTNHIIITTIVNQANTEIIVIIMKDNHTKNIRNITS